MFHITHEDVASILQDYNIAAEIRNISELQRYHYERDDPDSKEVRLIVKVNLEDASSFVIRFKNEEDVTLELIENQSRFADVLKRNGIITPIQYQANGKFANWYTIGGYDVIVTLEQFVENEIKVVDETIAKKTGELLAKTHTIAEQHNLHVENDVLFNPFADNDLFAFDAFMSLEHLLEGDDKVLFDKIVDVYNSYMEVLAPLRKRPQYAVQGDISDCNLYLTQWDEVGIFDFNRSGDNILYCDAVMQAIFEARLMDYPENKAENFEAKILASFWDGYCSVRSFTKEEQQWYPYLYAIIDAFWSSDIRWNEDSLLNAHKAGDSESIRRWLLTIWERLAIPNQPIPI